MYGTMNFELALVVADNIDSLDHSFSATKKIDRLGKSVAVVSSQSFESECRGVVTTSSHTLAVSGIAVIDGQLASRDENPGLFVKSARSDSWLTGSFLAFVVSAAEGGVSVRVLNDLFGLTPVFECRYQNGLILSNSLNLAIELAEVLGVPLEVDRIGVISSMFSDAGIGLQISTSRTPYSPIRLLPLSKDFAWSSRGVNVNYSSQVARAERIAAEAGKESYSEFLRLGVQDIVRTVDSVTAAEHFDKRLVNITGGKDSRLIAAAVQASGQSSAWRAVTNGVANSPDVLIGASVAHLTGIRYLDEPVGELVPIEPGQILAKRQKFYRGTYHEIRTPAGRVKEHPGSRCIRLIGGCGELYRGFYHRRFLTSQLDGRPSADHIFSRLRQGVHREAYSEQLLQPFKELLNESLVAGGGTMSDALSTHYMEFRHRLHIGYAGLWNSWLNPLTLNPLASANLYIASRILGRREREEGRLIHDAIYALGGELAHLEYEDAKWVLRWASDRVTRPSGNLDDWRSANMRRSESAGRFRAATPTGSWSSVLEDAAKSGMEALHASSLAADINVAMLSAKLTELSSKNQRLHRVWISRLAMFADLP